MAAVVDAGILETDQQCSFSAFISKTRLVYAAKPRSEVVRDIVPWISQKSISVTRSIVSCFVGCSGAEKLV